MNVFVVDAFTGEKFRGNPAAVCILSETKTDRWMQLVAREMNLSETAFIHKNEEGYGLRWFTPEVEVDLCGHATLASAHILWELKHVSAGETIHFHTKSGELSAVQKGEWIELDFPLENAQRADAPAELIEALGVEPLYVGMNRFDYLIEVESEDIVRSLQPDLKLMSKVTRRGVMVTAVSGRGRYDFVSRFFAPSAGIDEDPVTGSAHCCLGPYWMEKLGKSELSACQVSERGGTLRVSVGENRVRIAGQAVTVLRGELLV